MTESEEKAHAEWMARMPTAEQWDRMEECPTRRTQFRVGIFQGVVIGVLSAALCWLLGWV
jgi:hypothetical protein